MKNKKDILIDAIGNIDDQYIIEAYETKNKKSILSWELVGKLLTGALCLFLLISFVPRFFRTGSTASKDTGFAITTDEEYISEEVYETEYGDVKSVERNANSINDYSQVTGSTISPLTENKKLIVTGFINIETLDFDSLLEKLNKSISEVGGYIQSSSISTNHYQNRNYDASIRIPANKYEEFISATKQTGNVTYYSESVDDITDTYTDLKARLNSLKTEESKVLEFYDKAINLEELMSVEERLTQIRYEIDSIETSIKNYDLLTNYSTLNITIVETKTYTETNDNFFSRLSLSFKNGISNFINMIENLALDIVYNIWTIALIGLGVIIVVLVIKRRKK